MEIIETKQGDASVFKILGRLDANTSPDLEDRISETMNNGTINMVLDFEALEYISSAGLRIILKTTKDLKRQNGQLILCSMQDYVREVFEISGFDSFLPIAPSLDDALKKF